MVGVSDTGVCLTLQVTYPVCDVQSITYALQGLSDTHMLCAQQSSYQEQLAPSGVPMSVSARRSHWRLHCPCFSDWGVCCEGFRNFLGELVTLGECLQSSYPVSHAAGPV